MDYSEINNTTARRAIISVRLDNKQATIYGACEDCWSGHVADYERLETGLIQLTKQGAEKPCAKVGLNCFPH